MDPVPKRNPFAGLTRATVLPMLACTAFLTSILVISAMYSRYVGTAALSLFDLPRETGPSFSTIGYLALTVLSYFRPRLLARRGLALGAVVATAACAALLVAGHGGKAVAPFVAGMALYSLVYVWMTFLFVCHLVKLASLKMAAVAVMGGVILRQLLLPLYSRPEGFDVGVIIMGALCCIVVLGLTAIDRSLFSSLADREPLGLLELTNPLSTLRPPNLFFLGVLLVSLTYNFSCTFGVPGLSTRRMAVVLLLFCLLWLLLVQREGQEDRLFSLAVLCIMAGLLMAPLLLGRDTFVSNTLLFLGSNCFTVLLWMLLYNLGRRSVASMIPVFGMVNCLDALGRALGEVLGQLTNALLDLQLRSGQMVMLGLALFFFAVVWIGFRRFSFTAAIRDVETIEEMPPTGPGLDAADSPQSEFYTRRCQALAAQGALTPREVEVLDLLARGRNARFIMDTLDITRNTAKAHISHIYAKLGVHSHQELLTLVEKGMDA